MVGIRLLCAATLLPACRILRPLKGQFTMLAFMQDFFKFLWDDMEMLKSARVHWTLIPSAAAESSAQQNSDSIDASQNGKRHTYGLRIAYPEEAKEICSRGLTIGRSPQAHIQLDAPEVRSVILLQHCGGQE